MATIRHRRNTAEQWRLLNPILDVSEIGFEIHTGKFKMGDGTSRWLELEYFLPESSVIAAIDEAVALAIQTSGGGDGGTSIPMDLQAHVNDPSPHPAYDDGPSFFLLYQNAKV